MIVYPRFHPAMGSAASSRSGIGTRPVNVYALRVKSDRYTYKVTAICGKRADEAFYRSAWVVNGVSHALINQPACQKRCNENVPILR
jgi:hypothetical protein